MAHAAGDAHEYPVYGYHFRTTFPLLDADGDLVALAAADSEISKDAGTASDCTNEATEIATSSGMAYLDLTGTEMTCKCAAVICKGTNHKTTPVVLYPRRLPALETGTAQAGAAGTITLAAGASAEDDFYNGLFVGITNDTPSGVDNQLRRIVDYNGTTKVATIDSDWGTNPSSSSTYEILIPEGYSTVAWGGVKVGAATNRGMTALPAAAADAAGGLPISDAGGLDLDALNTAAVRLTAARAQVLDDWINDGRLDAILDIIAGDVVNLDGAAMRGTNGASTHTAADVWAAATRTLTANTNLNDITAASVWAVATRTLSANTNLNDPTAAAIADAVLKESIDDHKATVASLAEHLDAVQVAAAAIKVITDALTSAAAAKLAASAATIVEGTVDDSAHTPTTTEFEADNITEATADHFIGRLIVFTSGVLANQMTDITDYALSGSNGHFTVTALTEAPGNNDTFIIL